MKLSAHLRNRIDRNLAVVAMFASRGWNTLLEDKIEPLEYYSWRDWKNVPAENHVEIVKTQVAGKIAEMVRNWQAQYEAQVEADREELRKIDLKQEEDRDLDMPEEEEVSFIRRWLNKYDAWTRRAQHV